MAYFRLSFVLLLFAFGACSDSAEDASSEAIEAVNRIADEFLHSYYSQFPEEVYEVGYPDAPMDRFGDHSEAALTAWNAKVDGWLEALDAIDTAALGDSNAAITYVFTREKLQALADKRVCRNDLWNISPTWTGWQFMFASTLAVQPVESRQDHQAAVARIRDGGRFLRTEIGNLRRGQDLGYTAAENNVTAVVKQVSALLDTPVDELPFYSPASRSDDDDFIDDYRDALESDFIPAMRAYRDFLANDYQGHPLPGVSANSNGNACYAASVRYWASIAMDADDIHRMGLSEMARIQSEMLEIARSSFGTDDVRALLTQLRTNPEYTFKSKQDMLDYVTAAVERGKAAVGDWFGNVPDAEMVIVESPAYEEDSGGGFYSAGTADGSRPGTYLVGTHNPTGISKAGQESTAFHESYPGHHLQITVALRNESLHPVMRYMSTSGTAEGWALYTERLADEMGLYSSDVARLGMLSNEAYRAARLVVDPGMHVMGWSRDEAIEYMLGHTAEGIDSISGEVDRYAAVPGQATSYLIGSLEIQRLRAHAEQALGDDFDIKEFHDQILVNGGVTLPMLGTTINAWIAEVKDAR